MDVLLRHRNPPKNTFLRNALRDTFLIWHPADSEIISEPTI